MNVDGYLIQILAGALVTLKLACSALALGIPLGLLGALGESIPFAPLRYFIKTLFFIIRGLPELLVLFFIYFGVAAILNELFHRYVDINSFVAGAVALSLIFGAYAAQVFRGAFSAIEVGQLDAGKALGLNAWQLFISIQLPQAWRHALPGLGNLWLILLKDTAIVSLIGLADMMSRAKIAAITTHQPFTFYLIAAFIYLFITTCSQKIINLLTERANRYTQL